MRSMTGFGLSSVALGDGQLGIEVRALNHRFTEIRVRLPPELSDHAFFLEQVCRARVSRGRYDVAVRLEGRAIAEPLVDLERIERNFKALCALRDRVAPGTPLTVGDVLGIPQLSAPPVAQDSDAVRSALESALSGALGELDRMKELEGSALAQELRLRLSCAKRLHATIAEHAPRLSQSLFERLKARAQRLAEGVALDPGRLLTELALLADRGDITEELVRLTSHFDQFDALLQEREPIGRKLDFLLQEIGRETNTIGSKCQDADLAHTVVELKSELERLREQAQNVE